MYILSWVEYIVLLRLVVISTNLPTQILALKLAPSLRLVIEQ